MASKCVTPVSQLLHNELKKRAKECRNTESSIPAGIEPKFPF